MSIEENQNCLFVMYNTPTGMPIRAKTAAYNIIDIFYGDLEYLYTKDELELLGNGRIIHGIGKVAYQLVSTSYLKLIELDERPCEDIIFR